MGARGRSKTFGLSAALLAAAVTFGAAAPASAQGIFEQFFSGLRRAISRPAPPPSAHAFTDPFTSLANALNPPRQPQAVDTGGPSKGFCVRTCDGLYFPVRTNAGLSAAESCRAFCPASETKLYSGSNIDYATARDGSRYANLENAYVYRQRLVAGCTCNGRTQFGLAHIDVNTDPTLRPGDIVATKDGLMAFNGGKNRSADFTPVQSYAGFSKSTREQLSTVKIMPPAPGAALETTSSIAPPAKAAQTDDGEQPPLLR